MSAAGRTSVADIKPGMRKKKLLGTGKTCVCGGEIYNGTLFQSPCVHDNHPAVPDEDRVMWRHFIDGSQWCRVSGGGVATPDPKAKTDRTTDPGAIFGPRTKRLLGTGRDCVCGSEIYKGTLFQSPCVHENHPAVMDEDTVMWRHFLNGSKHCPVKGGGVAAPASKAKVGRT